MIRSPIGEKSIKSPNEINKTSSTDFDMPSTAFNGVSCELPSQVRLLSPASLHTAPSVAATLISRSPRTAAFWTASAPHPNCNFVWGTSVLIKVKQVRLRWTSHEWAMSESHWIADRSRLESRFLLTQANSYSCQSESYNKADLRVIVIKACELDNSQMTLMKRSII